MTSLGARFIAVPLVLSVCGCSTEMAVSRKALGAKPQEVHGTVSAVASSQGYNDLLPLPDVEVWIREVNTAYESPRVRTDLAGRYIVTPQPPGLYRVCWAKAGWASSCLDKPFKLGENTAFPGLVRVFPQRLANTGVLRGTALLADGNTCWYKSELYRREDAARVEVLDSLGRVLQSVRANDHGEFVVTQVPTSFFQLRTSCGGEIVRQPLTSAQVDLSGHAPHHVVVPNARPAIQSIVAYRAGAGIQRANTGETIELRAEAVDPDGHALKFDWRAPAGSGALAPSSTSSTTWTLPSTPGRHSVYALVSDGRGGLFEKRFTLPVGVGSVVFSGVVVGSDGPPVKSAAVVVNGVSTTSNAEGAFVLRLPAAQSFNLHIEAEGYAELGRRLQAPSAGTKWVLTRAHRQVFDPTVDTVIVDGRREWLYQKGRDGQLKKRRPARLTLLANTLVGPDGKSANPSDGPFSAYIATFDPNGEDLPGDYGAVNGAGKDVFMVSYGAVAIDIRDAAGRKYNLAPGAKAQLETPIQDPQLLDATPPGAAIPMWTYEPANGTWRELASGGVLAGAYYVAQLTSFSTKNADLEKTDPACIHVQVDSGVLALGDLKARIDLQVGTTSFQRRDVVIDDAHSVLYNVPRNVPFSLELFQGTPPNDTLIFAAPAGNTGAAWGGTGAPAYPFSDCNATVNITTPIAPVPFLQYGKGIGSAARAAGYYAGVDPLAERTTLGDFWAKNGFDPATGAGGTRTSFLNDNDLGFGRDMHCRQSGADVACYVSNYGEPDQDPGNADLAQVADQEDSVATVAMEYSAVEGQNPANRIVKFYVYNGGVAASARIDSANLDKAGAKFVPNLCLVCHGGNYNPANEASPTFDELNMGASFREFDVHSFKYPGLNPLAAQEPSFRTQNLMVAATNPAPAISELITEFYAGGPTVDPNAVPPLWKPGATGGSTAPRDLYLNVVGKSCRTCHVAQPGYDPLTSPPSTYPDWSSYAMFRDNRLLSHALVCSAKVMPNAVVTSKNFWRSLGPHRPEFFGNFVDAATGWNAALGACTP